jgi:N-acyl-D-aspartate/D-glutamate deacylase
VSSPGSGARRLMQRAEGYVAAAVSGRTVYRDGQHSCELPGRQVRGSQGAAG